MQRVANLGSWRLIGNQYFSVPPSTLRGGKKNA